MKLIDVINDMIIRLGHFFALNTSIKGIGFVLKPAQESFLTIGKVLSGIEWVFIIFVINEEVDSILQIYLKPLIINHSPVIHSQSMNILLLG